jgi:hypothetical protein
MTVLFIKGKVLVSKNVQNIVYENIRLKYISERLNELNVIEESHIRASTIIYSTEYENKINFKK